MKDEGAIEPPYGPAPLDDFCQVRHQRDHSSPALLGVGRGNVEFIAVDV